MEYSITIIKDSYKSRCMNFRDISVEFVSFFVNLGSKVEIFKIIYYAFENERFFRWKQTTYNMLPTQISFDLKIQPTVTFYVQTNFVEP